LKISNEKDFEERRNASLDAKKAMLEKFRTATRDTAAAQVRAAERRAVADNRHVRVTERKNAKLAELAREEQEAVRRSEAQRKIEAERQVAIAADQAARAEAELSFASRVVADEAVRKAARDARYAARKARKN
jgi:hypothetical protein